MKMKKTGYEFMQGEFSAQDEREEIIAKAATVLTYKVLITLIPISCAIFFTTSLFISNIKTIQTMTLLLLGGSIIISFMTYLIKWISLDKRY